MNKLKPEATEKTLRVRDKIFIGLGMTMAIVAVVISQSEYSASPGLTWFTFIVGLYLVLRGMKKPLSTAVSRLDNTLERFMVYRITRWIVMKVVLLVLLILDFIFSIIADEPERNNTQNSPMPSKNTGEGAWDVASNHYYDKEPPPPFLKDDGR